ncbi:hypothetical protein FACS1894125_4580 [Actinomycetota bacterium]|nr:hypothetical protein FACS1894125_4580 [Actinomycetota bacterium]
MEFEISEDNDRKKKCPVCGFQTLPSDDGSFWICEVCWWEDDDIQADDPNYEGGANGLSLNQCRAIWLKEHHRDGLIYETS